jgi:hypothetical protein
VFALEEKAAKEKFVYRSVSSLVLLLGDLRAICQVRAGRAMFRLRSERETGGLRLS